MHKTTYVRGRLAITATAALALVAPLPAQADPPADWPRRAVSGATNGSVSPARPDDRAGMLGIGALGAASGHPAELALASNVRSTTIRPDDAAAPRGPGALSSGSLERPLVVATASSFRWGDAALGALAATSILVAGALAFPARLRRRVLLH